ncbi:MAG TPA: hypothetical protein VF918_04760, partial [Anaerolineales bacterium]
FFLETKRVNEDLNDPKWVKQAIDYAWTKSVTWALLSNFEGDCIQRNSFFGYNPDPCQICCRRIIEEIRE